MKVSNQGLPSDVEQLVGGLAAKENKEGHQEFRDIDTKLLADLGFPDHKKLEDAARRWNEIVNLREILLLNYSPCLIEISINDGKLKCGEKLADAWNSYTVSQNAQDENRNNDY